MQARRVPADTPIHELEPGDVRWTPGDEQMWFCAPSGEIGAVDKRWAVSEDAEGRITVSPSAPGEAHSIWLDKPKGWHGFLTAGVWTTV